MYSLKVILMSSKLSSFNNFGRTQIVSKKLSAKLLNDESFEDIKITFNEYMIQYYMHKEQFMDIFRAYNSVYNTSLVKNDSARAVEVLAKACSFLVLAQHDNEQHDFLHRLRDDSNMEKIPSWLKVFKLMTTNELIMWATIETELKADLAVGAFTGEKAGER